MYADGIATAGFAAASAIVIAGVLIVTLLLWVLQIAAYWNIFTKAGQAGWKSLIPIYADYVLYKIAWKKSMFWVTLGIGIVSGAASTVLLFFTTQTAMVGAISVGSVAAMALSVMVMLASAIVALVIQIVFCVKLSRAFGYGGGFAVGLIFLEPVFLLILGFDHSQYVKNQPQPMVAEEVADEEKPQNPA